MSVIGRTPFIDKIVNNLDKSGVLSLASLLNNLGSATTVSLKSINDSNKGVSHVIFNLDELQNKNVEGILIYSDATHCGLFVFDTTSGNMYEYEIDPTNKTYIQIYEHLTVEELRQICGDRLVDVELSGEVITETELQAALAPYLLKTEGAKVWNLDGIIGNSMYDYDIVGIKKGDIIVDYDYAFAGIVNDVSVVDGEVTQLFVFGINEEGQPLSCYFVGGNCTISNFEAGTKLYLHIIDDSNAIYQIRILTTKKDKYVLQDNTILDLYDYPEIVKLEFYDDNNFNFYASTHIEILTNTAKVYFNDGLVFDDEADFINYDHYHIEELH